MKKLFLQCTILLLFIFIAHSSTAQISKADCQKALAGFSKENSEELHLVSGDGDIEKKYVMSYVTSFEFQFLESSLVIAFKNAQSETEVYYSYIPYNEIRCIHAQESKDQLTIVMKD